MLNHYVELDVQSSHPRLAVASQDLVHFGPDLMVASELVSVSGSMVVGIVDGSDQPWTPVEISRGA